MKVFFATPCLNGQIHEPCFLSYLELFEALRGLEIDFDLLTLRNESLIPRGRNICVREFLKSDADFLMFIDADMEFPIDGVLKLLDLNKSISVGAYRFKHESAPYGIWKGGKALMELPDEPCEVQFAATGFMCVSRETIERMCEEHKDTWCEEDGFFALFDCGPKNGVYMPEDYTFCDRWREMGGSIWLDPSIELIHWGSKGY